MSVLRVRGAESEADIPFAGLLELLRPTLGALGRASRRRRRARCRPPSPSAAVASSTGSRSAPRRSR